ncbi:MAG: hypothetical protein H7Y17_03690 [Chlorobia bacterium]|nr:hypothetical protein [Fimbriimonadaceae bacterium]
MRNERQFIAPMSAVEAAQRAQYVLGKWKFKFWSIPGGIRFERSVPLAGLMVIHPHQVHSRIDLHLQELGEGACRVFVKHQVFKFGQPSSNLDKIVWLGDVEDLEAALQRREEPKLDRNRQDRYAGAISIKFILATIVPPVIAAIWLVATGERMATFLMLLVLILVAILFPFLPFRMPHFPLENQLPPFDSNYVRGRQ